MSDVSLIEFYAPWCSPCMYMKSVVEKELENNNEIKLVNINVDEETEKAVEHNIRCIPTLLLMKDNSEVGRLIGSHSLEKIREFISNL